MKRTKGKQALRIRNTQSLRGDKIPYSGCLDGFALPFRKSCACEGGGDPA